ncbi:MAG TPA: glycosyltransferase, partial [Dokdonella sp.]|nr:glycosyltransferase [Dokdonella sp.]
GLGFLTKGPPALLPLLAVVTCSILAPSRHADSPFHWSGLLVFAATALPWYLVVIGDTPGLLEYFLHREVVERVASNEFGRHGEWYGWFQVYAPTLIVGSLPWTWMLWRWLRGLPAAMRGWRQRDSRQQDADGLLLALWVLLPLLVFCVSQSRLPLYLLPLFTPLALIAARQMRMEGRLLPRPLLLGAWLVILLGLRPLAAHWPTHKDAGAWADALRTRVQQPIKQVVFVEDMARYGIHLHLGAQVHKVSIDPLAADAFGPEYDTDLDTELARADGEHSVYICKETLWPRLRAAMEARDRQVIVHGQPFEGRVIFSVRQR